MSEYVTVSTTNTWDTKYVTVFNTWARKDTVTSYFTKYTLCTGLAVLLGIVRHLPPPITVHLPGGQLPPPHLCSFFWRTIIGFFDLQLMEDIKDGKEKVLDEVVMERIKYNVLDEVVMKHIK